MLKAKATPNFAGITLSGDRDDFEAVYEALHMIVGEEGGIRTCKRKSFKGLRCVL
ncbi:DUF6904 family protein [Metabacillus sp. HB246100]